MRKIIRESEQIPAWYGCAYRRFAEQDMICYPIPFNFLATLFYILLAKCKRGLSSLVIGDLSIAPGTVVQLDPIHTENKCFGGCFMIVEEVKPWGAQGKVASLGRTRDERIQFAYYRAKYGSFKVIGKAAWWEE